MKKTITFKIAAIGLCNAEAKKFFKESGIICDEFGKPKIIENHDKFINIQFDSKKTKATYTYHAKLDSIFNHPKKYSTLKHSLENHRKYALILPLNEKIEVLIGKEKEPIIYAVTLTCGSHVIGYSQITLSSLEANKNDIISFDIYKSISECEEYSACNKDFINFSTMESKSIIAKAKAHGSIYIYLPNKQDVEDEFEEFLKETSPNLKVEEIVNHEKQTGEEKNNYNSNFVRISIGNSPSNKEAQSSQDSNGFCFNQLRPCYAHGNNCYPFFNNAPKSSLPIQSSPIDVPNAVIHISASHCNILKNQRQDSAASNSDNGKNSSRFSLFRVKFSFHCGIGELFRKHKKKKPVKISKRKS